MERSCPILLQIDFAGQAASVDDIPDLFTCAAAYFTRETVKEADLTLKIEV